MTIRSPSRYQKITVSKVLAPGVYPPITNSSERFTRIFCQAPGAAAGLVPGAQAFGDEPFQELRADRLGKVAQAGVQDRRFPYRLGDGGQHAQWRSFEEWFFGNDSPFRFLMPMRHSHPGPTGTAKIAP